MDLLLWTRVVCALGLASLLDSITPSPETLERMYKQGFKLMNGSNEFPLREDDSKMDYYSTQEIAPGGSSSYGPPLSSDAGEILNFTASMIRQPIADRHNFNKSDMRDAKKEHPRTLEYIDSSGNRRSSFEMNMSTYEWFQRDRH